MRKELIILAVCSALLPGCRPGSAFRWTQRDGALCLAKGDSVVGRLDIAETEGISHSERTERLDGQTFSITCVFKAARDVEDARLQMGFTHLSPSSYWMIPAVSYNGNHWGKGREPKGADENGQWRTVSYRRTPIPGAMYSEGSSYAFATWSEAPQGEREDFSVSIQPDGEQTRHCYLWPDEEMPVTYSGRDRFDKGYRKTCSLRKGEEVTMKVYVHVAPVQAEHAAMRSFLRKAWEMARKPRVEVASPQRLWELGTRYARESLWAEEGDYRGFSIGLLLDSDGNWQQRLGGKYEIGWCGQNASYAISLLHDYLKNGNRESLEKGMATLDTWSRCALPNGLFVCHYDNILYGGQGAIDACNLGTAAVNYFEACDVARQCGFERPGYENLAYAICDFVMNDQQASGCYAKGWKPDGEALYREGTVGCFMVPALIEAYRRSRNEAYLTSARKAYDFYIRELHENGFTTAGALDTWCIDKESSISLLRSALRFYRLTGEQAFVEDAVSISYYLSTWLWHYDEVYPEGDNFADYGYHTFGATSVSVQHNHLDPYALYWVPEWIELADITGDRQWLEKARAIWRNGNQFVSDGKLEINGHLRPAGSQNEAYFECQWGFTGNADIKRINDWLVAWPGAFRLETLRRLWDKMEVLEDY